MDGRNGGGNGQEDLDENVEDFDDEDLQSMLRQIAERAGQVIMVHYAKGANIAVRRKDDSSPVTAADEAAEAFILQALETLTPEIPVVDKVLNVQIKYRSPGVLRLK